MQTNVSERISVNPKVMNGKPCIKGTRIPVYILLDLLSQGLTAKEIISPEYYPDITIEDVFAAITYANMLIKNEEIVFAD